MQYQKKLKKRNGMNNTKKSVTGEAKERWKTVECRNTSNEEDPKLEGMKENREENGII